MNTSQFDRVFVEISSIDPVEQIVWFSDYVYRWEPQGADGWIEAPVLTLETACLLRDEENDQIIRYERAREVKGGVANTEWLDREDCQVGIIGTYALGDRLTGFTTFEQADAEARADWYLHGHAVKYLLVGGETRQYVGIRDIEPDGKVQQVTYSVGQGATTSASTNTEHSNVIPPYPARRRAENLAPDMAAVAANAAERQWVDKFAPKPPGAMH